MGVHACFVLFKKIVQRLRRAAAAVVLDGIFESLIASLYFFFLHLLFVFCPFTLSIEITWLEMCLKISRK